MHESIGYGLWATRRMFSISAAAKSLDIEVYGYAEDLKI